MALRAAINASFVWTETVDLGRSIALLAVTVAMLLGLSFAPYSAISLLMWVLDHRRTHLAGPTIRLCEASVSESSRSHIFFFASRGTSEGPVLLSGCLADGGTRPR